MWTGQLNHCGTKDGELFNICIRVFKAVKKKQYNEKYMGTKMN